LIDKEEDTIARKKKGPPAVKKILDTVVRSLDDDKGEDIVVIDLAGKAGFADYMVIASGRSQRSVSAMSDHLIEKLKTLGLKGVPVEGKPQCDWVLVDAGDVVVHLFRPEIRSFYGLEKMWRGPVPHPEEAA
jgi:ribosome-associated protein